MDRGWYLKLVAVLGVCLLAVYFLYPSYVFYVQATEEQRDNHEEFCASLPSWSSCSKFNLGLDLQGGVHLVMGVRAEKAVEQRVDRLSESLREAMNEKGLAFRRIDRPRNTGDVEIALAAGTDEGEFERFMRRDFSVLDLARRVDGAYVYRMLEEEAREVRRSAVDQALKTIRNRADRLGVTEPVIAKRGEDNILIQLPGIKDPEAAIRIIGRTAQLQFKIADEAASQVFDTLADSDLPAGVERLTDSVSLPSGESVREVYFELPASARDQMRDLLEEKLAGNREVGFAQAELANGQPKKDILRTYVLQSKAGITGDYLTDAAVRQNPEMPGDSYVTMDFDPKGAKIFEKLTEQNVGRRMAIVLDGTVTSRPPVIQERIGGGTARITLGSSTQPQKRFQEARELVLVLKAGALPAPVEVLDKRQVGKTLGQESVESGVKAIVIGLSLVLLFMLLYYRGSGFIADMALTLNLIFVMAVLALFEATLTLPGMAGILLTIGMAVDANVIIFERIREELVAGKTPRAAIDSGYAKAFSTIFDANVTTLIAGVVLMQYGEGPIRGFAVTLIVGILCSMFTAIVVTRLVFDFFSSRRRMQRLSI